MSSSNGSVTHWIAQLNAGNRQAAQELWNRYFHRIVGLARKKLYGMRRRMADEEDIALSAFKSFYRRAEQGEFPALASSDDLWPLLVRITACKAYNLQRDERRAKRGGDKLLPAGSFPTEEELAGIIGVEPSPEFADHLADEFRELIQRLPDPEFQQIALLKLEGKSTREAALEFGINERRIQRRLKVILALWREELSR